MTQGERDDTLRLVVLLVVAVFVLPGVVMTVMFPTVGMMAWGDGHVTGGMMSGATGVWAAVMGLLWISVLAAVVYGVYRVFGGSRERRDPALEELREAYARGDLTREEYEERRETLREE